MTVFNDPFARLFDDSGHSVAESREIIIGLSQKERFFLLVYFTEREGSVRIFSARKASKLKRQDYEETHRA